MKENQENKKQNNNTIDIEGKSVYCRLHAVKNGKYYNLYIITENGTKVAIKLAFYNRGLEYKLLKEIESN